MRGATWCGWRSPSERLIHWWPERLYDGGCQAGSAARRSFSLQHAVPNGQDMSGRFVTAKSSLRNALVFVVSFTDAQGNVTRHPMSPTWPLEVLNTMTLMERDGKT